VIDTSKVLAHAHWDDRLFQLVHGRSSFKPFSSTLLTLTLRKRLGERLRTAGFISYTDCWPAETDDQIRDIAVHSDSAVPLTVCSPVRFCKALIIANELD